MPLISTTQVSKSLPFDNEENGFISDNAEDAIVEARSKSGFITYTSFTGNPKRAVVLFDVPFPISAVYGIVISGKDVRQWSSEDETVNGFTICSNANQPITQSVYWVATRKWG